MRRADVAGCGCPADRRALSGPRWGGLTPSLKSKFCCRTGNRTCETFALSESRACSWWTWVARRILSSVVRSAFGDLVFPCRTECPHGTIGKLKTGGIIAAVSVPLAASGSRYRLWMDQDGRIQSNGVSAALASQPKGKNHQRAAMRARLGLVEVSHGWILIRTDCMSILFEKHPRRIVLWAETVFRLSSYCFGHWHEDTPRPRRSPLRWGRFFWENLIRQNCRSLFAAKLGHQLGCRVLCLRLNHAMNRRTLTHWNMEELGGEDACTWSKTEHHARRGNCCVRVSADHSLGSFKVLHEQDRGASAFWFGPYLLAWKGSLLGRDTD